MSDRRWQGAAADKGRDAYMKSPRGALLGGLLLLFPVLVVHLALGELAYDDAYIHFRIARHLASHGVPFFNLGEAVMGSSSSVWTLMLALPASLGLSLPATVPVLNALFTTAGAVAFVQLLSRLAPAASGTMIWLFVLPYVSMVHYASIGLMETPLALLALALTLIAVFDHRPLAFVAVGALPFFRLEWAVFVVLLVGFQGLSRGRWLRTVLLTATGALPFVLYNLAYFGTLIPHAIGAKRLVYSLTTADFFAILSDHAAPFGLLFRWSVVSLVVLAAAAYFASRGAALLMPLREGVKQPQFISVLLVVGGLGIALTYFVARGFVFPWYVPLFAVPIVCGVIALGLSQFSKRPEISWACLLVIVLIPHGYEIGRTTVAAAGRPYLYERFEVLARVRTYMDIGARLAAAMPNASIMAAEIGGLGETFPGHIYDGVGLVSPKALKYHPLRVPEQRMLGYIGAIPPGYVEEVRPELIVGMDEFVRAVLASPVRSHYTIRRTDIYGPADALVLASDELWYSRFIQTLVRNDLPQR